MAGTGTAGIIIAAFMLDCLLGDPQNPFHPMRIIGTAVSAGVGLYRRAGVKSRAARFAAGAALAVAVVGVSYAATAAVLAACYRLSPWLGMGAEAVICYFLIAARALKDESMKVCRAASEGDLEGARRSLSFIVGRDTGRLGFPEIIKAAVETVAENFSDGVAAPLFYIAVGGAPLGMAYKAVNTLDSMIGYRNEEFEHFGKFAARLDDAANFIPSRLAALLMIAASFFTGGDFGAAARIYARDRLKHKSPNSAQTESACAGALGLRLGGDSSYGGVTVRKPAIGDDVNEPRAEHIIAANRLMYAAAAGAAVLAAAASVLMKILF